MFFLFTFKNKEEKKLADLKKKFADFQELNFFTKLKTLKTHFFEFLSFINLPWDNARCHTKFGPDRFSRFDVYWIQTDRQTDRQTDKPNLYIDFDMRHCSFQLSVERFDK